MRDYVGLPITTAFTSIFSLQWQLHKTVVYTAHFAIRFNNNLFYRFSKIEAGGGPETKNFIGVAYSSKQITILAKSDV